MTTQLSLYNGALGLVGQARLSALTDTDENRYILDGVWDEGALKACLEQGAWNFAMRSVQVDSDSDVTPAFGFQYGFTKPDDWVRTIQLASDEYFYNPLTDPQFVDEGALWFSDTDPLFVRYISDDDSYGGDMSLWPQTFVLFFESYLAMRIAPRVTADMKARESMVKMYERAKVDARSKDAMNEGTKFLPQGSWVGSRRGTNRGDRGSRARLTG